MDERIKFVWLQTSGTGQTDTGRSMGMTTYNSRIAKSAERYFNKITRNNQGNVK